MRGHAKSETKVLQCPLMRLMQIEEHIDKHVNKLLSTKGRESTLILTDKSDDEVDDSGPMTVTSPAAEFPYTGPELKALREDAGLTQVQVAVELGMKPGSSAAIGDWEAERVNVPPKHYNNCGLCIR